MNTRLTIAILVANLLLVTSVYSQVTQASNIATGATEYVGWGSGTSKNLDIQNQFGNRNINFFTNNGTSTTQKMTILGINNNDDGNVGIGLPAPKAKLHVVSTNQLIGTLSQSLVTGTGFNTGVMGTAQNSTTNIGGEFNAYGSSGVLYGVRGNAGQGFIST